MQKKIYAGILLVVTIFLSVFGLRDLMDYNRFFRQQRMWKEDHSLAEFIRANTNYYDVVYSPDYEINCNPPQDLAISRKRIYRIPSLQKIPVYDLPDYAVINILTPP